MALSQEKRDYVVRDIIRVKENLNEDLDILKENWNKNLNKILFQLNIEEVEPVQESMVEVSEDVSEDEGLDEISSADLFSFIRNAILASPGQQATTAEIYEEIRKARGGVPLNEKEKSRLRSMLSTRFMKLASVSPKRCNWTIGRWQRFIPLEQSSTVGLRVEQQMVEKKDKMSDKEEYLREIEENIKKAVSLKMFLKADKLKRARDTAREELNKMETELKELEEELQRINEEMANVESPTMVEEKEMAKAKMAKEKEEQELLLQIAQATTKIDQLEKDLEAAGEEEDYTRAHLIYEEIKTLEEDKKRIISRLEALGFSLDPEKPDTLLEDTLVTQNSETTVIWADFKEDLNVATLKLRLKLLKQP